MARKLLSLVVALAVVLSSMSFAFAADPKAVSADVKDAKVKLAVEKLVAFGMVEGIDGKYVPDQKLKRSELTKLIVMALGLGPAADAAMGATQFSDVGADHWASGYITVAAGQGLVQGMGDGTFSPDTEITFAQALTILVRALGYKDEFLKGVWPGNYLAKASEKGIYAGITITPGAAVKRGDFAVLMSNTLDAKIVTVGEYKDGGVTYVESSTTTLMKDKFKLDKIEVRPIKNARLGDLGVDKVTLKFKKAYSTTSDGVDSAVAIAKDATSDYTIADGVSVDTLMGESCYAYYNKDVQKITYIESSGISTVYYDGIDKFTGATDSDLNTSDIKLRWLGKQYTVEGGDASAWASTYATIWLTNNGTQTNWESNWAGSKYSTNLKSQDFGKFVIESNKIIFVDVYRYDTTYQGMMVKSVDEAAKSITYTDTSASESSINLSTAYSSFKVYLADLKGGVSEMALKDVKPYDVVYLAKARVDQKDVASLYVFRKTATGVFTSVSADGGKLELDSKSDSLVDFGKYVAYSKDNNATFKNSSDDTKATNRATDLNDFYNQKVTIIYDNNKKIRHMYGESVNSSEMFGIIKEMSSDISKQIRVYTINDESVLYTFEDTDKVIDGLNTDSAEYDILRTDFVANAANTDFTLIKFKLNKDGKIAKNTLKYYTVDKSSPAASDNVLTVNANFGETSMTGSSNGTQTNLYVDTEVKVFNLNGASITSAAGVVSTSGTWAVSKWDNFKNKEVTISGGQYPNLFVLRDETNRQTIDAFIVLDSNLNNATVDQKSAYLINSIKEDSKDKVLLKLFGGDGTTVKYELDSALPSNFVSTSTYAAQSSKESAVIVNVTSAGKVKIYGSAYDANQASLKNNYSTVAGLVYKKEGNAIYIGNASTKYTVASDALIYREKDKLTISDILENRDAVVAVVKNGTIESLELIDADSYKLGLTTKNMTTTFNGGSADYKAVFLKGYAPGIAANEAGYYVTTQSFDFESTNGEVVAVWGNADNRVIAITK